jgi:hypothetical protein
VETSKRPVARIAVLATVLALAVAPTAFAGKGPGGGGTGGSNSVALVLVDSSDAVPNWGETVTFKVSSTAQYPSVETTCYQNGTSVYTHSAGFYPTYPWLWAQSFVLSSYAWTGGAADCTAKLYTMNSKGGSVTLATLGFHVYP